MTFLLAMHHLLAQAFHRLATLRCSSLPDFAMSWEVRGELLIFAFASLDRHVWLGPLDQRTPSSKRHSRIKSSSRLTEALIVSKRPKEARYSDPVWCRTVNAKRG